MILPCTSPPLATGSGPGGWRLTQAIVALSVARTWHEAKAEWEMVHVFLSVPGDYGTCLCGHAIREHCVIRNRRNGNTVAVGNCCVKRFLDIPSERVFAGLRRIQEDPGRSMGIAALEHFHRKGVVNTWEYDFYLDNLRKHRLSPKQQAIRQQINRKVLGVVARRVA